MRRLAALLIFLVSPLCCAQTIFTVDSTLDEPDAAPGNGVCASASGACTLRAAIHEVHETVAAGDYEIRLPPGVYQLSRVTGDLLPVSYSSGDLDLQPPLNGGTVKLLGWNGGAPPTPQARPIISAAAGFPRRLMEVVMLGGQTVTLRDVVLAGAHPQAWEASGVADNGAAIQCRSQQGGTLEIERVRFDGNEVPAAIGGALFSVGCRLALQDVAFDQNCGRGGALVSGYQPLAVLRRLHLQRVSFTGNDAACTGLDNPQNHALSIQSNLSAEPWDVLIADTTFGQNLGALQLVADAGAPTDLRVVQLRNVTVHANTPDYLGYDGLLASGDMAIEASHVVLGVKSRVGNDARLRSLGALWGTVVTESGGTFTPHASDLGAVALAFDALGDTGAYTAGFMPKAGSVLIDTGALQADDADPAACTVRDQAGTLRPVGIACDVGAIEYVSYRVFADGFE